MRLSELITLYLVAAAPSGVAFFQREQERGVSLIRALIRAAAAGALWPLTVPRLLLTRRAALSQRSNAFPTHDERRVERAKRALINELRAVEDLLGGIAGSKMAAAERHALFAARECVERYVGLTLAVAGAQDAGRPTEREMELCRIAGRTGDDLLLAGLCVHRRNVSRLIEHRARARAELAGALVGVREITARLADDAAAASAPARQLSETLIRSLALAVELLSLLEDREGMTSVARLLEAECARLPRSAPDGPGVAPAEAIGGEICTVRTALEACVTTRPPTTTSAQG